MTSKKERQAGFNLFSPTDFRYGVPELLPFLSEESYVKYKARIEAALALELSNVGLCSKQVASEIEKACKKVTAEEVYEEEDRIKHDIRALVNVIRSKVSKSAKPYVHLTATSYDIVDTANSLRFKEAINQVILPDLIKLERALIEISRLYADRIQVGRTHGQHAEPITFGFFISNYVSRLGTRILNLNNAMRKLTGKFAGAVGVYGPLSLLIEDPEKFERNLLHSLGLEPSEVSTQIVQPEPIADLMHSLVSTQGVIANFCRDMRHLQRSEIDEVTEEFSSSQVGSSTMPQKRNPISFENIESLWKKIMPQMITVYMDQVSEHQRDLTNSSSQRYLPELITLFDYSVRRLTRTIWNAEIGAPRISVNAKKMQANFDSSADRMAAEPLYILLASEGHEDAHEYVRRAVQESISSKENSFRKTIAQAPELRRYYESLAEKKKKFIEDPSLYTGIATKKTIQVARKWQLALESLEKEL